MFYSGARPRFVSLLTAEIWADDGFLFTFLFYFIDTLRHWQIRVSIIPDVGDLVGFADLVWRKMMRLIWVWRTTVLLEAPFDPIRRQMNSVLLTIDLTKAVADEAIERKDCVVVSYRMLVPRDMS